MKFTQTPGNGAHTFEFIGFGAQHSAAAAVVPTVQVVEPAPLPVAGPKLPDGDLFVLLARRIREHRAAVKSLRAKEAELELLEKMAAAAGLVIDAE